MSHQTEKPFKLLIANRGEIAIRISHAAQELGIHSIGIFAEDDASNLHTRKVTKAISLKGKGPAAYLDIEQIIQTAKNHNCNLIHPGYGFLSENAQFAHLCQQENIQFVGPNSKTLELFGNKIKARQLAEKSDIPVIPGISRAVNLKEIQDFFHQLPEGNTIMIKALNGGGGKGMRKVSQAKDLEEAFLRCQSEAKKAFGSGEVYIEQVLENVRHVEVQVLGDQEGQLIQLGERECSLQRNHQKLVEIAPCPGISEELRQRLFEAAIKLARASNYKNAGTIEFLVGQDLSKDAPFYFLEANPRIQVEHTVTEEVMGIDLVKAQLQIAMGATLSELSLHNDIKPIGTAIQIRINTETFDSQGQIKPGIGQIKALELPSGKGLRIDTCAYTGYQNSPNYDSLLAKLICHTRDQSFEQVARKIYRSICEFKIEGIPSNLDFLKNLFLQPAISNANWNTNFIDEHITLLSANKTIHPTLHFQNQSIGSVSQNTQTDNIPEGLEAIKAPMPGTIISLSVKAGDEITAGQELLIVEAMKMETVITANQGGIVQEIRVKEGELLLENQIILLIESTDSKGDQVLEDKIVDLDYIRPDLAEVHQRKSFLKDENRPKAIEKRRKYGQYTARENIAALCDEDSFREYGGLTVAAQRKRRSREDLIENTPADGLVSGFGNINGQEFGQETSKCLVMSYDYTVLAGTQGTYNHMKMDRLLHLAEEWKVPIVIFAEGGGGRPGDVDFPIIAGLNVMTFTLFARMSGLVPRVSIVSRYCFAGNAALAGCADVIIATKNTSLGMGGPAMIEGGGLGQYHPAEVGPAEVMAKNGVIDILVEDEKEAITVCKQYLSYFQGTVEEWQCADQRLLRSAIPENRRRVYDIRNLIKTMVDEDSFLELRSHFGLGMITALVRVEGRPLGLIANNPKHLGGAIDTEGADKAARFMQLCNAFSIPILSLCDTPGIMVGPDAEKSGTVRHASRLFVIGGSLDVPVFTIILRKGYGLGAQAMAGGSFHVPAFTVAWPTGEFGAMGLEGAVKLGFRKELEKVTDPEEQKKLFEMMVAKAYERGKGLNMASKLEIDDVIDPIDSRKWIVSGLDMIPKDKYKKNKHRIIDTW